MKTGRRFSGDVYKRQVVEKAAGRVPVVVSGHISKKEEDQIEEISRMAKTGADAVVLVTNRLALELSLIHIW